MVYQALDSGVPGNENTGDTLNAITIKVDTMLSELYSTGVATAGAKNLIFATPSGVSGVPSFRAMTLADLPTTGAVNGEVLSFNGTSPAWSTPATLTTPVGALLAYAVATAPAGWVICDGSTIGAIGSGADSESTDYETLFDILKSSFDNAGTESFIAGDTVKLPNLNGRVLMGSGTGITKVSAGNVVDQTGTTRVLGTSVGGEDRIQQAHEVAPHIHRMTSGVDATGGSGLSLNSSLNVDNGTTETVAADQTPPSVIINYIIKYK